MEAHLFPDPTPPVTELLRGSGGAGREGGGEFVLTCGFLDFTSGFLDFSSFTALVAWQHSRK